MATTEILQTHITGKKGNKKTIEITVKNTRPDWETMKANYPTKSAEELYADIGGSLLKLYKAATAPNQYNPYTNTCAIRMSWALNHSGVKLPRDKDPGGSVLGKDGLHYWIRVRNLTKFIVNHFKFHSPPDIKASPDVDAVDKFKGKKGIIVFDVSGWGDASGHFTLWDGTNLLYPGDPIHDDPTSDHYYFNMKYLGIGEKVIRTTKIRLWELEM